MMHKTRNEAIAAGETFYLPDELCPRGHYAWRRVYDNSCRNCPKPKEDTIITKQRKEWNRRLRLLTTGSLVQIVYSVHRDDVAVIDKMIKEINRLRELGL